MPEPRNETQAKTRTEAASANSETTADAIEPAENVLDIVVYEDDEQQGSSGAAAARGSTAAHGSTPANMGGGARIQRGGAGKVKKIIRVKTVTPEIEALFLGFKPPSTQLTDDFLTKMEKSQGHAIIDNQETIQEEYKKYGNDGSKLIDNTDTRPFFVSLGPKAVHKSTISRMVKNLLDDTKIRPLKITGKTYIEVYSAIWRFMFNPECIEILRDIFRRRTINISIQGSNRKVETNLESELIGKDIVNITKKLTWQKGVNTLFDDLFKQLSTSTSKGIVSDFLTTQVSNKGQQQYRFMLNWIILIAFHLYHIADPTEKKQVLIDCGEFIENLYTTFIGWMNDKRTTTTESLKLIFTTGVETYETKVKKYIEAEIISDPTLQKTLIPGIQEWLCSPHSTPISLTQDNGGVAAQQSPRKSDSGTGSVRKLVDMFEPASARPTSARPASARPTSVRPASPGPASPRPASPRPASNSMTLLPKGPSAVKSGTITTKPPTLRPFSASPSKGRSQTETLPRADITSSQTPADERFSITGKQLQPFFTNSDVPAGSSDSNDWVVQDMNEEIPAAQQHNNTEFTNEQMIQIRKTAGQIFDAKDAATEAAKNTIENLTPLRDAAKHRQEVRGQTSNPYSIHDLKQAKINAEKRTINGGKPRTRKHNSAKPQTTTIRKRSTHPANQRKYTRRARRDRVSGSAKRTKRVKNNLG